MNERDTLKEESLGLVTDWIVIGEEGRGVKGVTLIERGGH